MSSDLVRYVRGRERVLGARLRAEHLRPFERRGRDYLFVVGLDDLPDADTMVRTAAFLFGQLAPEIDVVAGCELLFAAALKVGLSEAEAEEAIDQGARAGMARPRRW